MTLLKQSSPHSQHLFKTRFMPPFDTFLDKYIKDFADEIKKKMQINVNINHFIIPYARGITDGCFDNLDLQKFDFQHLRIEEVRCK